MVEQRLLPGLGPAAVRPVVTAGVEVSRLPLNPKEGYVLSRVDGHTSYGELLVMSGLDPAETQVILLRLTELGAIHAPGVPPRQPPSQRTSPQSPSPPSPSPSPSAASPRSQEQPVLTRKPPADGAAPKEAAGRMSVREDEKTVASAPPRARKDSAGLDVLARLEDLSPVDPDELVDAPTLDEATKRRLVRVARVIESLPPHEILGVPEDETDLRAVKRAYLSLSKNIHPDRFFGKELGAFRGRLERIFRTTTTAFSELEAQLKPRRKHKS